MSHLSVFLPLLVLAHGSSALSCYDDSTGVRQLLNSSSTALCLLQPNVAGGDHRVFAISKHEADRTGLLAEFLASPRRQVLARCSLEEIDFSFINEESGRVQEISCWCRSDGCNQPVSVEKFLQNSKKN